jgi:hypothetical protein
MTQTTTPNQPTTSPAPRGETFRIDVLDHETQRRATVTLFVSIDPEAPGPAADTFHDFARPMLSHINRFLKEYTPDGFRVLGIGKLEGGPPEWPWLDEEEKGALCSAAEIVLRSTSGDGPYLAALERGRDKLAKIRPALLFDARPGRDILMQCKNALHVLRSLLGKLGMTQGEARAKELLGDVAALLKGTEA